MSLYRKRILLEGTMPERALLKLRRAQIPLFHIEKPQKNQILFHVMKKDVEKVFAIYPKICYNGSNYGAYQVADLGAVGIGKSIEKIKRRVGILLGGLLGLTIVLASQPLVLSVDFVGTNVYARETYQALDEAGIGLFSLYKRGEEDSVCAKLLALDDVEFCSIKKIGYRLVVETRLSPFQQPQVQTGAMRAKHAGEIIAMTVLRGSPLKQVGDTVRAGETLVGDWFSTEGGGQVRVEIIARVCIACTYEADIEAESAEGAFAKAYLALGLTDRDTIKENSVQKMENLYRVKLVYQAVETVNF
jgi:hypothetical protein